MSIAGGSRFRVWLLILSSLAVAHSGPGRAEGLLGSGLPLNESFEEKPSEKAAALHLGRVRAALDQARWKEAQGLLEEMSGPARLEDHVEFQRIRFLAAQDRNQEVVVRTQAWLSRFPESPVLGEVAALRAQSLLDVGEEMAAREAWELALGSTEDPGQRAALRRLMVGPGAGSDGIGGSSAFDPDEVGILVAEKPIEQRTALEEVEAAEQWASSGRNEKAVAAYQRSLQAGLPLAKRKEVQFELGRLLFQLREYERALEIFRSLAPEPRATFMWARSLARVGRLEESIQKFESLIEGDSHEEADHSAYLAGTLYEGNGNEEAAIALYVRVVEKTQSERRRQAALWRLGWLSWRRGEYEQARLRFDEMRMGESSPLDRLRPRYWSARAALHSSQAEIRRAGQAEMVMLATQWPLSYYGWRAQERLGRVSPHARASRHVELLDPLPSSSKEALERIRLLQWAGFDESAQAEVARLAGQVETMQERVELGRLAVNQQDFHTGQSLLVQAHAEWLGQGFEPSHPALFWLAWPPAYRSAVLEHLPEDKSVEAELVWAIMREESGFRPAVMSSAGAVGLLQLMPETARNTATRLSLPQMDVMEALERPESNIQLGAAYLDHLSERFPGRVSAVIASYNAGPSAVGRWLEGDAGQLEDDEWVEEIPYTQTRTYTKRVLRSLYVYRSLY